MFRKPPSASDLSFLSRPVVGIQDLSPETDLRKLNPVQISRLVELRSLVSKLKNSGDLGVGKFTFSLELLEKLRGFVDQENNLVQRVAYKSVLKKIRDDLLTLSLLQEELKKLMSAGASESALERAHDSLEDVGSSIQREFTGFVDRLQNDVLSQGSLAASSLYRASLQGERTMYVKLDKEGKVMLRKWNDVRLEVINLLATTNHDVQSKQHLNRMLTDLNELLSYLDDFALLPWLAPREVVAAIYTIDRRLRNYQDEYNLAQTDHDRISNVIEDRNARDERREAIAQKFQSILDRVGFSRNLSVGGAVRLTRGTFRALSMSGMFLTRTLPNVTRSVLTSVRTLPKRVVQTAGQFLRLVSGPLRRVTGLSNTRGDSLDVRFRGRRGRDSLGLGSTISRGYSRSEPVQQPFPASTTTPDQESNAPQPRPVYSTAGAHMKGHPSDDGFVPPGSPNDYASGEDLMDKGRDRNLSSEFASLRSLVSSKIEGVRVHLDQLREDLIYHLSPSHSSASGELEELRRIKEVDLLSSISKSLERLSTKLSSDESSKSGGSLLDRVLSKAASVKSLFRSVLSFIGGLSVVKKSLGVLRYAASLVTRSLPYLLKMGSLVMRVLAGPVGLVLGAGAAGWQIGSAIHEKYSAEIAAVVDRGVESFNSAAESLKSWWGKGKELVSSGREKISAARNAVSAPFVSAAKADIEREMSSRGSIHPVTKQRADGLGIDTSSYPVFGKSSSPQNTPAVIPPQSQPSASPPVMRSSPRSSASVSSTVSPSVGDPSVGVSAQPTYTVASGSNLNRMQPGVMSRFDAMVAEYQSMGGTQPVRVNRGFATHEQQAQLFQKYGPGRAARPGFSAHNHGVAIDIDRGAANEMDRMGLLSKHGFERPVRGEPWHLQVAGVTAQMARNGIYSADHPSVQGDRSASKSSGMYSSPSMVASSASGSNTDPVTNTGLPPEKAAYEPSADVTTPQVTSEPVASRSPVRGATPAGHGASRIPEFSYADPTFFAMNLGAIHS